MKQFVCSAFVLGLIPSTPLQAQNPTLNDLKGKIIEAQAVAQNFAKGLKYCGELNGTNFFLAARDRVLSLEDYHRSLENLAKQGAFNAETKRPWSEEDAAARWGQAQKDAVQDKANCELVASLPKLQKQLAELEKKSEVSK